MAPTKLVDGSWLYSVLKHWSDIRLHSLVETFLEELGIGDPDYNHVLLYKKLIAAEGGDELESLGDRYYFQGAIQLALGYHGTEFLAELVGYNLGYEQLPLHLLISAYELGELGIDPYYFTLHVTVDNGSSGHARRAVQAVMDNLPAGEEESDRFYQGVRRGYMLGSLGVGSVEIIQTFDIESEVIDILKRKSYFGQVHSDYCRIEGLTVNQWLADSEKIPDFLRALKEKGWIKCNEDPRNSRFWRLLQGPKGKMSGVFNVRERTLIYEWIAGSWLPDAVGPNPSKVKCWQGSCLSNVSTSAADGRDAHSAWLPEDIETLPPGGKIQRLIALMAPGKHHTPVGLLATRYFCNLRHING